ncbi:hypothetical protein EW146_g4805 [Bondarzewia mesenterica]|uniref:Uncharacterized protein n=1 Tax=Bondarzewia mesenterica TaxID=1095465 RepID=A0A4S4LTF5_9AGAM|nr:hypothetical protein EW146_g4805 [Bondarzewia mesenterica]
MDPDQITMNAELITGPLDLTRCAQIALLEDAVDRNAASALERIAIGLCRIDKLILRIMKDAQDVNNSIEEDMGKLCGVFEGMEYRFGLCHNFFLMIFWPWISAQVVCFQNRGYLWNRQHHLSLCPPSRDVPPRLSADPIVVNFSMKSNIDSLVERVQAMAMDNRPMMPGSHIDWHNGLLSHGSNERKLMSPILDDSLKQLPRPDERVKSPSIGSAQRLAWYHVATVGQYLADTNRTSQEASNNGLLDKERYVIPPHLHDLQEADLLEMGRGLVISDIAQFRERAAKCDAMGKDAQQGYRKLVGFVKAEQGQEGDEWQLAGKMTKTDEELESERKEARHRDEENSSTDNLERVITWEQAGKEAEGWDKVVMGARLDVWDDDESDELFYTGRMQ